MARYDTAFAELQAKLAAVMAVLEQHPGVAEQVRETLEGTEFPDMRGGEPPALDEARANALAAALREFDTAIGVKPSELDE